MIEGIKSKKFAKFQSMVAAPIDQGDFRHIGNYILSKIRKNESILKFRESEMELPKAQQNQGLLQQKTLLLAAPQGFVGNIKLNTSIAYDQLLSTSESNFLLLYRNVFTMRPLQMISVIYSIIERKFVIHINNHQNSKTYTHKLRISEAEVFIPYIKSMIELRLYFEIGLRLFKAFKNKLLISSYSIWKKSEYL